VVRKEEEPRNSQLEAKKLPVSNKKAADLLGWNNSWPEQLLRKTVPVTCNCPSLYQHRAKMG